MVDWVACEICSPNSNSNGLGSGESQQVAPPRREKGREGVRHQDHPVVPQGGSSRRRPARKQGLIGSLSIAKPSIRVEAVGLSKRARRDRIPAFVVTTDFWFCTFAVNPMKEVGRARLAVGRPTER